MKSNIGYIFQMLESLPPDDELLVLTRADVLALLGPDDALDAVRRAFGHQAGNAARVFPVVREPLQGGAVFGIKSGDIAAEGALGLKAAGYWPGNGARGLDAHQATVLLVDPATGRARALIDGNPVTTLRTGAAGGLGLQRLARPGSARLCVFGTGVQARVQVDFALRLLPALRTLDYVTASGAPDAGFEALFRARCTVRHAADADAAVAAADVVITATPSRAPLFAAEAVRPGTHINAVGADTRGKRELPEGLLMRSRVVADDAAQARELGEAQWAPGCALQELGALLAGHDDFRRAPGDITVFDMTGLALQDLAVAADLLRRAVREGRGQRLRWPA